MRWKNYTKDGREPIEEVIKWSEGEGYEVSVLDKKMPFKNVTAGMNVNPIDKNSCEVFLYMNYSPKWGVAGSLMHTFLIQPSTKKIFSEILNSLCNFALTKKDLFNVEN